MKDIITGPSVEWSATSGSNTLASTFASGGAWKQPEIKGGALHFGADANGAASVLEADDSEFDSPPIRNLTTDKTDCNTDQHGFQLEL